MARKRNQQNTLEIAQILAPYIQTAGIIAGIVLWAYSTFAQISYVKEQNQSLQMQIEKSQKELQEFSDRSTKHLEGSILDLKDLIKSLELRIVTYQDTPKQRR